MPKSTKTPQCTWKRGSPIRTRSPTPCPVQAKRPKNRAAAAPSPLCPKRSPNSITCRRAGTRSSPRGRTAQARRAAPHRVIFNVLRTGARVAGPIAGPRAAWPASKCSTYPPSVTPLLAVLWIYITVVIALHLPVESVLEWGSLLDFNLIWQMADGSAEKIIYALCDSVRAGSPPGPDHTASASFRARSVQRAPAGSDGASSLPARAPPGAPAVRCHF